VTFNTLTIPSVGSGTDEGVSTRQVGYSGHADAGAVVRMLSQVVGCDRAGQQAAGGWTVRLSDSGPPFKRWK